LPPLLKGLPAVKPFAKALAATHPVSIANNHDGAKEETQHYSAVHQAPEEASQ